LIFGVWAVAFLSISLKGIKDSNPNKPNKAEIHPGPVLELNAK